MSFNISSQEEDSYDFDNPDTLSTESVDDGIDPYGSFNSELSSSVEEEEEENFFKLRGEVEEMPNVVSGSRAIYERGLIEELESKITPSYRVTYNDLVKAIRLERADLLVMLLEKGYDFREDNRNLNMRSNNSNNNDERNSGWSNNSNNNDERNSGSRDLNEDLVSRTIRSNSVELVRILLHFGAPKIYWELELPAAKGDLDMVYLLVKYNYPITEDVVRVARAAGKLRLAEMLQSKMDKD